MVTPRNGSFKLRSPSDQENDMVLPYSSPVASSYDSNYGQYTAPTGVYGDSQPQGFFSDQQSTPQPRMQEAPDIAEAYGVGGQKVNPLINLAASFVRTAIPTVAGGLMGHKPGAMAAWQHASDQAAQERKSDEEGQFALEKAVTGDPKFQAPYQRAVSNYNASHGKIDGVEQPFQAFLAKEWQGASNGFNFEHQPTLTGLGYAAQLHPGGPEAKAYAQLMADYRARAGVGPSILAAATLAPRETVEEKPEDPTLWGSITGAPQAMKTVKKVAQVRPKGPSKPAPVIRYDSSGKRVQ